MKDKGHRRVEMFLDAEVDALCKFRDTLTVEKEDMGIATDIDIPEEKLNVKLAFPQYGIEIDDLRFEMWSDLNMAWKAKTIEEFETVVESVTLHTRLIRYRRAITAAALVEAQFFTTSAGPSSSSWSHTMGSCKNARMRLKAGKRLMPCHLISDLWTGKNIRWQSLRLTGSISTSGYVNGSARMFLSSNVMWRDEIVAADILTR